MKICMLLAFFGKRVFSTKINMQLKFEQKSSMYIQFFVCSKVKMSYNTFFIIRY